MNAEKAVRARELQRQQNLAESLLVELERSQSGNILYDWLVRSVVEGDTSISKAPEYTQDEEAALALMPSLQPWDLRALKHGAWHGEIDGMPARFRAETKALALCILAVTNTLAALERQLHRLARKE